jgi:superfamily II DNA or RNA helicase
MSVPDFNTKSWDNDALVLTQKGYRVLKSALSKPQEDWIRRTLTVKPETPEKYDMGKDEFPVFYESKLYLYLPRDWALKLLGEPHSDIRSDGIALREEVKFIGKLREEQYPIVNTFIASGANGLLCVPCGYGKTFMAIWLAFKLKKRFLVVVHKEFLMSQWKGELESLCPGIRIGIVQGKLCEIEADKYDASLVMIQTLCNRDYSGVTFKDFGFSIFDECHHLGAEHFSKSLLKIQCKHMLGLSATPDRPDGLEKVFIWFLGPISYQIKFREADSTVRSIVYRYETEDKGFTEPPVNKDGEVVRARLVNQIAYFKPRTEYLSKHIAEFSKEGRRIIILSERKKHLKDFEVSLKKLGVTDIGYYVGGMAQEELDKSSACVIILGTFAMAAEAMNIPALNTILLATPKSNVEQSVGRILREKKEVRKFSPLILDVLDHQHHGCIGQYRKRRDYYKACGYKVQMMEFGSVEIVEDDVDENADAGGGECLID